MLRAWKTLLVACGLATAACGGSTGGALFSLPFALAGLQGTAGAPLVFTTPLGWQVSLSQAKIALGPFYFNVSPPPTDAFRGGTFIVQVTEQRVIDALDPTWTTTPTPADGQTGVAVAVEINLLAPDINASDADANLLGNKFGIVAGIAVRGSSTIKFAGPLAIDPSLVSPQSPLAALARVNGAVANLAFTPETRLLQMEVDPTHWFDSADFSSLGIPSSPAFNATWSAQSTMGQQLVSGVTSQAGVYQFSLQ